MGLSGGETVCCYI